MWEPILAEAREQAEGSRPAVQAAALLHIARVLAARDPATAQEILERGIGLAKELSGQDREMILGEAPYIAAAVSPKIAISLYVAAERNHHPFYGLTRLMTVMATHGHAAEAIEFLSGPLRADKFPLDLANKIARECNDADTRRDLLRATIRAWREVPFVNLRNAGYLRRAFVEIFARFWEVLPRGEAFVLLTEIVEWIRALRGDSPFRWSITGKAGDPEFTSENQYLLFPILPALRRLDPTWMDPLCKEYSEFARAARRFPMGYESANCERESSGVDTERMNFGRGHILRISEALVTDFAEPFEEAFRRYEFDTAAEHPNDAPKECWPSTNEFRNILYTAGRHQGVAAVKYPECIPDADIRLLAQIELSAGLSGLPRIEYHSIGPVPKVARSEFRNAAPISLPTTNACLSLLERKKKIQVN